MPYRELLDRLERGLSPDGSVVSLPDGSVDTYYRVFEGRRTRVDSRTRFAELLADGRTSSVRVERESREAGGQAVNLAKQVDALGGQMSLYGHLDDPVFDGLGFPARSMGIPSEVQVYDFEDDDVMISEDSEDVTTWSLGDLRGPRGRRRRRVRLGRLRHELGVLGGDGRGAPGARDARPRRDDRARRSGRPHGL